MRRRALITVLIVFLLVIRVGLVPTQSVFVASLRNSNNALSVAPNVAYKKTTSQSSTYTAEGANNGLSSNAVDGNTDGVLVHGSISHTLSNPNAWWQVDLGAVQSVGTIRTWNRALGESDFRETDFWVFVSSTPFTTTLSPTAQAAVPGVTAIHYLPKMGYPTVFTPKVMGRYVMVQLSGTDFLQLAEVQVYNVAP